MIFLERLVRVLLRGLILMFVAALIPLSGHAQSLPAGDIIPRENAPFCLSPSPLTLAYVPGGGNSQQLDLYLPTISIPPYPTVILIHGGGWALGDKTTDISAARRLVCRGYAVASINYRLSGTAKFPAQIYDVKAAIRYLRANARSLALDPLRFATLGDSAGGHLSMLAASSRSVADLEDLAQGNVSTSSHVQAAVSWFGHSDFAQLDAQTIAQGCGTAAATHGASTSYESMLLGCTVSDAACAPAITRANPATYVSAGTPPMLFLHGTRDCVVPNAQSTVMKAAMYAAGRPSTKRDVLGAEHGGPEWDTAAVQDAVVEFFDIVLVRRVINDLSGDRKSDLVFKDASGNIGALVLDGVSATTYAAILPGSAGWTVTQIADVDGDGKADLVIRNTDGRVALLIMNGTRVTSFTNLLAAGSGWTVTHAADFNGDGKADLVMKNTDGRIAVLIMNGATTVSYAELTPIGSPYSSAHVGDFNGDGKADIVLKHIDGSTVILLMNGATVSRAGPLLNAGSPWTVTHVADLDGDAKADIILRNINSATAALIMDGTSVSSAALLLTANSAYTVTHTGDFNGDGRADLILKNTDGSAILLQMNGTTVTVATTLLVAGSTTTVSQVADYNGDGKSDMLLRNADGSATAILMNGGTVTAVGNVWGAGTFQAAP